MAGASSPDRDRLTAGGVLSSTLELYRRQVAAAWSIVALIVIPFQVLAWIVIRASLSSNAYARNGVIFTRSSVAVPSAVITVIGFLSAILAMGALSRLLIEVYTGHRPSWQRSLGYAGRQLLPLLLLALVALVCLAVGYTLFILPGLLLTVSWCAAVPALMFERIGPLRALGRSSELVRGHGKVTFAALLVALVIVIGISFLVDEVLAGPASSSSIDLILTLQGISRALGAILTYPFLAAVSVVIYANLRAQKEEVGPEGPMPGM